MSPGASMYDTDPTIVQQEQNIQTIPVHIYLVYLCIFGIIYHAAMLRHAFPQNPNWFHHATPRILTTCLSHQGFALEPAPTDFRKSDNDDQTWDIKSLKWDNQHNLIISLEDHPIVPQIFKRFFWPVSRAMPPIWHVPSHCSPQNNPIQNNKWFHALRKCKTSSSWSFCHSKCTCFLVYWAYLSPWTFAGPSL